MRFVSRPSARTCRATLTSFLRTPGSFRSHVPPRPRHGRILLETSPPTPSPRLHLLVFTLTINHQSVSHLPASESCPSAPHPAFTAAFSSDLAEWASSLNARVDHHLLATATLLGSWTYGGLRLHLLHARREMQQRQPQLDREGCQADAGGYKNGLEGKERQKRAEQNWLARWREVFWNRGRGSLARSHSKEASSVVQASNVSSRSSEQRGAEVRTKGINITLGISSSARLPSY